MNVRFRGFAAGRAALFYGAALAGLIVTWALLHSAARAAEPTFQEEDVEFFEKRVRPILARRCFECHGADATKLRGGLRLDSRVSVVKGGETGPAAVPGDADASLLVEAIGFQSSQIEMPPSGKIPDAEIADLREWVRRGLPFPSAAATAAAKPTVDLEAGRRHWAFQPLADRPGEPNEKAAQAAAGRAPSAEPPRSRIDLFLRAAQDQQQLAPSPPASPATLIRRLKFDLLGLPPTPEETADFLADTTPDAYARRVDRWLASPRHGERFARFWLDLTRYCDVPEQWREGEAKAYLYRDWVVAAVNSDMPYADFVRRQLAADLLPNAHPADNAALGFLGLSPTYWKELKLDPAVIKQVVAEEWEERIEAIGATFLGLTLACARCHDHKYDPVTTQDYYALAGVLVNVRQQDLPIVSPELAAPAAAARKRVKELEAEVAKLRANKTPAPEDAQKIEQQNAEIARLRATPLFDLPPAFGVTDASLHVLPDGPNRTKLEYRPEPQDVALQIRGNPSKAGAIVPRRFLSVLARGSNEPFRQGSGRRELAEAIVTDAAPLAARVAVNRLWLQHFGRGLVASPSNFGLQTETPRQLELLNELAARFIAAEWSMKSLRRELVLSATFRQSSGADPRRHAIDPDNATLWRMPVRRLDVESWRDAMLAADDQLDLRIGGPPTELADASNRRRTLYGLVRRRELSDLLRLYDFPDPVAHSAARDPTTTPLQQLFVLNSPFMSQRSEALAQRLLTQFPGQPAEQVRQAYLDLFNRAPTTSQTEMATGYLAALQGAGQTPAAAWQQLAQVLLGSNEFLFID